MQERIHQARLDERLPDTVLLMQHRPVVTMGRRGRDHYLLRTPDQLAACGIELFRASRGGDVTFHGPGQWVLYPIMRLGLAEADAHGYLHNLEEIALRTAADFGVKAFRRPGMSGAWADGGKFAAIGFYLKRWVTLHGMSFNVDVDLAGFNAIVPCGLEGQPVASLRTLLGAAAPTREAVRERLAHHFAAVCGRRLTMFRWPEALPEALAKVLTA